MKMQPVIYCTYQVLKTFRNILIIPFVVKKKVCIFAPAYAPIGIGASAGKARRILKIENNFYRR